MQKIIVYFLIFLKYFLFTTVFGFVLYGVLITNERLNKSIIDSITIFMPFIFVFLMFIFTIFFRKNTINKNLLFNFISCFCFLVIILICLRAKFDDNMLLYYKYNIGYNPAYFSINLPFVSIMLYMIGVSNLILLVYDLIRNNERKSFKTEKVEEL